MTIKWIVLILAFLIIGCLHRVQIVEKEETFSEVNDPKYIYLEQEVKASVDSLHLYYQHALKSLSIYDTLGARIYFEKAFDVISNFNEDTKAILMEWTAYDSLIYDLNHVYEQINIQDIFDQEAEEVRQELTQIEEEAFGDSTELQSISLAVDSNLATVPIQVNSRVELAIKYFQTKGRKVFKIWMERSGKYERLIKSILREKKLPEDLFYVAMIESGFNPSAFSYARASGLWQFIYATGKYYGLRSNWWFDERRDPLLSTNAAAEHLQDLYDRFGHWYLAMAGYNCNPKKIESRMRQYNTRDFWKLRRLPRQTRNYVPTYLAALIIAKNPKKYGFFVDKMEEVEFDTLRISDCVDLNVVAQCVDTTFSAIKNLNPAVRKWCTPPGVKDFLLYLPKGKKDLFKLNYAKVPDDKKRSWVRHKIRNGETLSEIATKYRTTINVIKSYNRIKGTLIRAGHHLVIPVPQNKIYYSTYTPTARKSTRKKPAKISNLKGHKKVAYLVKAGDTLGQIAEDFNTRASKIRAWNGLYYGQYIYPKQKLTIWVPEGLSNQIRSSSVEITKLGSENYHVVRTGDTLWDIAQRYQISVQELKMWNKKRSNKIKPGEKLIITSVSGS